MKLDIVNKKKNPLMGREEFLINLEHEGKATLSRNEIFALCEKELKAPKETIIVDRIFTRRGQAVSEIKVLIYRKKEDIPRGKLDKMKRSEKKKKPKSEEKPEEAKKKEEGEKKSEEKPENKKEQAKKEVKEEEEKESKTEEETEKKPESKKEGTAKKEVEVEK